MGTRQPGSTVEDEGLRQALFGNGMLEQLQRGHPRGPLDCVLLALDGPGAPWPEPPDQSRGERGEDPLANSSPIGNLAVASDEEVL